MGRMVGNGEVSSPPIDFPVYGLVAWSGWRWFEYYQAANGRRAWAVGLGHRSVDSSAGIIVSALRRDHYDMTHTPEVDPLTEIALEAAVWLGNATLPEPDVPKPRGLLKALVDHMRYQSERYRDWPVARWTVDGNPVTGPILNFADGWTTFTDAVPHVYLSVLGLNTSFSSALNVMRVSDLHEYGIDPEARLSPSSLTEARKQHVNAELPTRTVLHPDFLTLTTSWRAARPPRTR